MTEPPGHENIVLNGVFAIKNNQRIRLVLCKKSLSWDADNKEPKGQTVIHLCDVVAATPCDCPSFKRSKTERCHYCRLLEYRASHSVVGLLPTVAARAMRLHYAVPSGRHMWRLKSVVFTPADDTSLKEWIVAVQDAVLDLNRPKRLLVFINPYGGKKKAIKIYERKVLPVFHLAGIEAHAVVTQRQNHAKDIIQDMDILRYNGIICVGGDGMFSEILNSVLLKTQKEKGVDVNDATNQLIVPRIPLGIIPAGSTNAAVNCITGSADPVSAALLIVMGNSTGVDLCGVYSGKSFLRFAITFLAYGYFGDVIRDSENIRWMGPQRYNYSGMKNILRRKLYEGELELDVDNSVHNSWNHDKCGIDCKTCSSATDRSRSDDSITTYVTRGKFIGVNAAIVSCACGKSPKGFSPTQHLGNGYCDVIMVSDCSRFDYLRFLLRIANHYKDPFGLHFVQVHRVKEFRFTPLVSNTSKSPSSDSEETALESSTGVWNCDGEVISEPTISAKIHCQLINVFGRGFEDRKAKSVVCCLDVFKNRN